jgi:ribonucleoside-triphosphate reductase (formate)
MKCGLETEVYSRVCGYHRPVKNWNKGKQEEFKRRRAYKVPGAELASVVRLALNTPTEADGK